MFEKASRLKLRFSTSKGFATVEDLWDLPLTDKSGANLDDLAKSLRRALKDTEEESFVVQASKTNAALQLSFDIVKHVIDVKLAEQEAAATRHANRAQKQKLLEILADKQDAALKGLSVEEIQARIEAL